MFYLLLPSRWYCQPYFEQLLVKFFFLKLKVSLFFFKLLFLVLVHKINFYPFLS